MKTRELGSGGPRVSSVGLGSMLLSIAGRPPEDQAKATIDAALEAGVTFYDTADAYCLDDTEMNHNERLLAQYLEDQDVVIATKCGCRRPGGAWTVDGNPEYLRNAAHASLEAMGVESLSLLQLHAPDSRVPFADSVGALAKLREEGKVRLVGLSNVNVKQIEEARAIVPIASVQNRWNPEDRRPETDGVLDYCTKHGIAFLPYSPFGGSRGAPFLDRLGTLGRQARRRSVSAHRLIVAWMLAKSPVVIGIPGARRPQSIADCAAAADLELGPEDLRSIENSFPEG